MTARRPFSRCRPSSALNRTGRRSWPGPGSRWGQPPGRCNRTGLPPKREQIGERRAGTGGKRERKKHWLNY